MPPPHAFEQCALDDEAPAPPPDDLSTSPSADTTLPTDANDRADSTDSVAQSESDREKEKKMRTHLVKELLSTEQSYAEGLGVLLEVPTLAGRTRIDCIYRILTYDSRRQVYHRPLEECASTHPILKPDEVRALGNSTRTHTHIECSTDLLRSPIRLP